MRFPRSMFALAAVALMAAALLSGCPDPEVPNPPLYTVTYVGIGANYGTVPVDGKTYATGDSVIVKNNVGNLQKTGFSLAGWNTAPDGSGVTRAPGTRFTMGGASLTLYAVWTEGAPDTYTVSYQANGATTGTAPADGILYVSMASVSVKTNEGSLAKTGFDFVGWNANEAGTGTTYQPGATFSMGSANVVLYAKWSQQGVSAYRVTYDANGANFGSVPVDGTQYASGATVTARTNSGSLAKTDYIFAGWNTNAAGTGTTYPEGATFRMGTCDVTLYAKWQPGSGAFTENMALPLEVRNYYRDAYGLSGTALKTALQTIITSTHSAKTYTELWTMFGTSDLAPNGKIWDMYSNTSSDGTTAAYWFTLYDDQDTGSGDAEGLVYNREHTWPKSTFGSSLPGYTDGHHIAPADRKVNSMRSDNSYGEVGTATWTSLNGSKLGSARSGLGYTGTVFEPRDFYKGDLARMHFYMALRYWNDSSYLACAWANAGAKLKAWYDTMLRAWAANDPVSAKEIARNNAVKAYQGNRNPFIDYPELIFMLDLTN